jgi:hypothetical protein
MTAARHIAIEATALVTDCGPMHFVLTILLTCCGGPEGPHYFGIADLRVRTTLGSN